MTTRSTNRSHDAFYLNSGIREVIPIYPLYAVMFGEHGVGPIGISVLFSIWAAVGIVTEVPSGALADAFSRKWLIVASGILKSFAFLTWFLFQDFYGFALGFLIWGVASSLRTGAWEALLHDLLKLDGSENKFAHHYGRINSIARVGVVLGELIGGVLIVLGYDIVLLVSAAVPLLASAFFIVLVTEPTRHETVYEAGYLGNIKSGVMEAIHNQGILYILLATTMLLIAAGILDEYVNPITFEQGFSLSAVAYLSAGIALAEAAGYALSGRFSFLSLNQLLALMATAAGLLVLMPPLGGYYVPTILGIFFAMFGMASTLFASRLQNLIEGSARATVTSVVSLGDGVGAILWFLVFGSMAEMSSMTLAATGFAVITALSCLVFYRLARRWGIAYTHAAE